MSVQCASAAQRLSDSGVEMLRCFEVLYCSVLPGELAALSGR